MLAAMRLGALLTIMVMLSGGAVTARAQFQILASHSTAGFRGVDAIGNGIAWVSGTEGTVLRTTDDGATWQRCSTPPGAAHLDFRGIQAFNENTAIVMSSGKGNLSRLYKTNDGCKSWKLVFTNPDEDGFWDAIKFPKGRGGILLGDPVDSHFSAWRVDRSGDYFQMRPTGHRRPAARQGEAAFAASNSSIFVEDPFFDFWIATGGKAGSRVIRRVNHDFDSFGFDSFPSAEVPAGHLSESSGIFSLDFRRNADSHAHGTRYTIGVAVGGDYKAPDSMEHIAAWTDDGGKHWTAAMQQPHGYRSSVAYDAGTNTWITVGPNGTDISRDDGKNWAALKPSPGDPQDADKNWNAISLPFVVGPNGRIGKLESQQLRR